MNDAMASQVSSSSALRSIGAGWRRWVAFALLILIALSLRLPGLSERGLLYWDEGMFLMGAKFVHWRVGMGLDAFEPGASTRIGVWDGFPTFLGKPGHVLLLAAVSSVTAPTPMLGLLLSIVCSLITIVLIQRLAARSLDERAGWIAALLLAISPYYLVYSRSLMHETSSVMLVIGGIWALERSWRRHWLWSVVAGVLFGVAVTASYRWIIVPPMALAGGLVSLIEDRADGRRAAVSRLAKLILCGVAVLAPVGLMEPLYHYLFTGFERYNSTSYFKFIVDKFGREGGWDLARLDYYPRLYLRLDGLAAGIMVLTGLFSLAFRRGLANRVVLIMFALTFVAFAVTTTRLARTISLALPLAGYLAAAGWSGLWRWNRWGRVAATALLLAAGWRALATAPEVIGMRSGYQRAIEWMSARSEAGHLSTMMPVSAYYLGSGAAVYPPPETAQCIELARQRGYRYMLVDWQRYLWYHPSIIETLNRCVPVKTFENPYVRFPTVLRENYLPPDADAMEAALAGDLERYPEPADPRLDKILIYDLDLCYASTQL